MRSQEDSPGPSGDAPPQAARGAAAGIGPGPGDGQEYERTEGGS
jgi:hypothetical protein